MKDITDPRWIKFKGILFVIVGLAAAGLLLMEHPTIKVSVLLAITVWCFCRSYYFAFYVIERYVDPAFRFSGLWSAARYLVSGKNQARGRASSG
jgi:hypothetical protein